MPAVPQRIILLEEFEQIARVHHRAVRAEVARAVLLHAPGEEHPRIRLGCNAYPRVGLAVFQEYVVAGLVLLDEVVLQQQGVGLGVNHAVLQVRNLAHQDPGLGVQPLRRHEILRHPLVQVLRLAHIYHLPVGIVVPIHPGAVRQQRYFGTDIHYNTYPTNAPMKRIVFVLVSEIMNKKGCVASNTATSPSSTVPSIKANVAAAEIVPVCVTVIFV